MNQLLFKARRIALLSPMALALGFAMTPTPDADAGSKDYTCPNGWDMKTSGSNGVYCEKPEEVRNNKPTCGIRRYKKDASGNTDWCTKTNGKKTGEPTCKTGGKKRVRSGYDVCVNPSKRKSTVRCPSGYELKGSTSALGGRGSVHCYKPGEVVVRNNKPTCGVRRYAEDARGNTDWCTNTRGMKTGKPSCKAGGKKRVVQGPDQCIDRKPGKTKKPR